MSSPSKIPRLRPLAGRKQQGTGEPKPSIPAPSQKKTNQRRNTKKKTGFETNVSQEKPKNSPPRGLRVIKGSQQKENNMPKTSLHDRRGIWEIKKSESNLRMRVESLEHDVSSMKHEHRVTKLEVEKRETQLKDVVKNESTLREQLHTLQKQNMTQARVLENLNKDPVTGAPIQTTDIFNSMVTSCEKKQITFAADLQSCMNEFDSSLTDIQNRLNALPNFETPEILLE